MAIGAYWPQYRTVVLDPRAEDFVSREQQQTSRFEDHWRGVEWLLARTPDVGIPRLRTNPTNYLVHVIPGNRLAETHELWILYSYDQDEVQVHAVVFSQHGDE